MAVQVQSSCLASGQRPQDVPIRNGLSLDRPDERSYSLNGSGQQYPEDRVCDRGGQEGGI
jgi:hypothetical protein